MTLLGLSLIVAIVLHVSTAAFLFDAWLVQEDR